MPWRNKSMIEERIKFVMEAINYKEQQTFQSLCANYNISTKTGYKWVGRFLQKGEEGLVDLPRTPKGNRTKISATIVLAVIKVREEFSKWGPKKICAFLKESMENVPSEASIGNILKKHKLSKPRRFRKHVAQTAPLSDCYEPNDTWMYDFKGSFLTANGSRCEPLTVTDGYSRFLLECVHMPRKREEDVWKILEKLFLTYGLPKRMRSDNGPPFATTGVGRLSRLAIKLIQLGITPEWIAPGCPQENGRHERFHLTLKQETASPPALNLKLQQLKFEQFKIYYNGIRPHEALGQIAPKKNYKPSIRVWDGKFRSPEYTSNFDVRKVDSSGHVSWKGIQFFLSENLKREFVGIKEINCGIMEVYYGPILLGHFILNKGFIRL